MTLANNVWTRGWLRDKGVKDQDIGWDSANKQVTLQGRPLVSATETGGRSYAPVAALQSAYQTYQGRQKPVVSGISATAQPDYTKDIADTLAELRQSMSTPFSYDFESDPRYKAAVKASESNVQRLSDQALGQLHARGRINSSYAADRLGQITSDESSRLAAMIPGMYESAYQQYQGRLGNMSSLANMLVGLQGAADARQRDERDYNYRVDQDTWQRGVTEDEIAERRRVADLEQAWQERKWAASPESDPRYKDLTLQKLKRDANAPYYKPDSGGSGTAKQSDWEGAIYSTADYYKSGNDYLADLEKYKQQIIGLVGVSGYRRLTEDAYSMKTGSKFVSGGNPMFTYANGSPLGTALKNAGVL